MASVTGEGNHYRYNFNGTFIKCFSAAVAIRVASTVMSRSLEFLNHFDECRKLDIHSPVWDRFSGINLLSKVSRTAAALLVFSAPVAFGCQHYRKATTLSEKCAGVTFILLGVVGASFILYNADPCESIIYPYRDGQYAELCGRIRIPIHYS